jgi:coenzyme F420 hydrogenase subunit beta
LREECKLSTATKRHWKHLYEEIVATNVCSGCAGCVVVCPRDILDYVDGKPVQTHQESGPFDCLFGQKGCTVCADACPRLDPESALIEQIIFGRERLPEEDAGIWRRIILARSTQDRVRGVAQDGGVVTQLLIWGLRKGRIDGALVAGPSERGKWYPEPMLARTEQDILRAGGSWYTYVATPLAMKQAVREGLERLAFVGTGCQTILSRKLLVRNLKRYSKRIAITIGLLCSETFDFAAFMEGKIRRDLGIELDRIRKINIKGRVILYLDDGQIQEIPLKEARPTAREQCHYCQDFAAEHADISLGGIGLDGWTLTIIRTPLGEQWIQEAIAEGVLETRLAEDDPKSLELLMKLAKKQRARPTRPQQEVEPTPTLQP